MLSPVYITVTFSMPESVTSMSECLMFLASMAWMNWRMESNIVKTSLFFYIPQYTPFSLSCQPAELLTRRTKKSRHRGKIVLY